MEQIRFLIYAILFVGVLLTQYRLVRGWIFGISSKIKFRRSLSESLDQDAVRYKGFMEDIRVLLSTTGWDSRFRKPGQFVIFSILIGGSVFTILYWKEGLVFSMVAGVGAMLVPYCSARIFLSKNRIESSREGDRMMRELLTYYKICEGNIKETVEMTAQRLENAPYSKKLLYDLARGFNNAYTSQELERELDIFRYNLNTAWGDALATTFYYGHFYGFDVTESFEDLLLSLTRSRKVAENAKRENNEAGLILNWLVPGSYIISIICACCFFDFSLQDFIRRQFATAAGLKWFTIMVGTFLCGVGVNGVFSKEKMDI